MELRFKFEKSLQAAALLLHLDGERMDWIRLLKLLYISDREMLATTGQSITGDTGYAMKHGPVLTRIYDFMKGFGDDVTEWEKFIRSEGHAVLLIAEPGRDELSRAEVEKLREVTERFRNTGDWDDSQHTHDFPEWKSNFHGGGASPIPWEDILRAQNEDDMIEVVRGQEYAQAAYEDVFGD